MPQRVVGLAALPDWGLDGWVMVICNGWLMVYPLLMLRRLFVNSWPKTIIKTALLAGTYAITLGVGFLVTLITLFLVL